MSYGKKEKSKKLEEIRPNAKKAERDAKQWLTIKGYDVIYWHENKASNLPYDIVCFKDNNGYALDVKTGKNPSVSLKNFKTLLNQPVAKFRKQTKKPNLKNINKIGYVFVIDNKCYLLEYDRKKYYASKAVRSRKARKK